MLVHISQVNRGVRSSGGNYGLDAVTGAWLMERASAAGELARAGQGRDDGAPLIPVRVDGKTVRGARNSDGSQVHLLAALAGQQGVVAAQTEVGAKTPPRVVVLVPTATAVPKAPQLVPLLSAWSLVRRSRVRAVDR